MIDGLKPHSEYKDSGLPWVGVLPTHWKVERAKSRFKKVNRPIRPEDETVTCFRDGTVTLRKNRRLRGFTEAIYELGYQGIRKGDLVIHAMDAFAGAVGVSDSDGKGSPIYGVCRPILDDSPYYYAHVVREMSRTQWILALSRGIRERSTDFRFESFARQFVPVPPPDEQAAIVKFLDYANGKIERAIRAKRTLIGLLNEQKQAIIHRAVTRGLDPNVKLKPSGIPWIGDVPEHWEIRRLKQIAKMKSGENITSLRIGEQGQYPVYGGNGRRGFTDRFTHDGHYALIGRQGALCGNVNFAEGKFWASEHAVIPTLKTGVSVFWFGALIRTMNLRQYSQSAAQPGLSVEMIGNLGIPYPSISEQELIAANIRTSTETLSAAIDRAEREIVLLREYRTTLTAEVVTGKLDVREASKRLPDQTDDPLPADESLDDLVDDEITEEDEA